MILKTSFENVFMVWRYKIDKLEIRNFKFFDEVEPLDFEGKNVLLYGENGSGKSSIYWAIKIHSKS